MQPSERRNPLARRQDEEIALAGDGNGQKELPISLIRRDGQTQPRDGMSEDVVTDYVAALADGVQFPPVDVMFDGTHYWLFDGFHRVETYLRSGRTAISARCYDGTLEEAQWRSYAANKNHGLRRSTADKERAIRAALRHAKAPGLSNEQMAKHLGVDPKTVAKYRAEMVATLEIPESKTRTGADGRTINTANIGKRPEEERTARSLSAPRPLNLDETIAVIWRLIKHNCAGDQRAETLHGIVTKNTKMTDYKHLLTSEVVFSFDTFSEAWTTVANELLGRIVHAERKAQKAQPTQPNPLPAVVEDSDEAPPADPNALPADLVERGWVLKQMAASGRWWCHNANGPRATSPYDTIAEAATAARRMQVDVAKPTVKPVATDEVAMALQRIEEAVADLVERLGLDMLRVRLDERQGNPWSLLASKGDNELNWSHGNIVGVSSALVNLGRKGAK